MPYNITQQLDLPIREQWDEATCVGRRLPQFATRGVDDVMPRGRGEAWHLTNHHRPYYYSHQYPRGYDWVERGVGGVYTRSHMFHSSIHSLHLDDVSGISIVRRRGSVRMPWIRYICRVQGEDCRRKDGIV